ATEPVTPSCTAYESGYPLPIRKSISIQNGIEPRRLAQGPAPRAFKLSNRFSYINRLKRMV
ncbi:hypothetical protein ACFDR9_005645, partial [Janthinobacterium sp. CG_23.3]|uniref:hypothetical protein n=1 Tax=Janthinobacterium sp. CG_23.3 TaxID=3349634 RepID=UPI0038D3C861